MAAPTTPERNSRIEWLLEQLIAKVEDSGAPGTVMKYGGRVDTVSDLPATGLPNQYYFVGPVSSSDFDEYVWAEVEGGTGHWDRIGTVSITIDAELSGSSHNPVENAVVTAALATKANNADLSTVATSGSYADLTNKPTLSTVATSGSYTDLTNTPTIDSTLSDSSTNAVQNKVVTETLRSKYDASNIVVLTKAEYDALGPEKYSDGVQYFVPDAGEVEDDLVIYGWHVDPSESDPFDAVTYLADAVGKTPAAMGASTFGYGDWKNAFFMPKPCMLGFDGNVEYYLDPDDYSKKADGTASDIATSTTANAMMEWPLIWYKFEAGTADGEGYFYCSNKKVDDSYKCWCNINSQNEITEHFYTAIYNVTGTEKARSLSGIVLTTANGNGNTTGTQEETRAKANNTTSAVEWYIETFADRVLISALLILMSKCLDDQSAFGRGLDTGGQSAKEAYITGTLDDKGLFWGDISSGTSAVKVFGMENFYGCVWQRIAGLVGTSNGYAYKLAYGTADGSNAESYNSTGTGYLSVDVTWPSTGYVSKMLFGEHGILPSVVSGSSSTFYACYFYTGSGCALFGGGSGGGLGVGSLDVTLPYGFGGSAWGIAGSLSCKPIKKNN